MKNLFVIALIIAGQTIALSQDNIEFSKKTSKLFHQYAPILDFKPTTKLTQAQIKSLNTFKEDRNVWVKEYNSLKSNLTDEFKIADKSTGIIDHYSKRALYSDFYNKLTTIHENKLLQNELERNINFYAERYTKELSSYSNLFPDFFINNNEIIGLYYSFENDLGFPISDELAAKVKSISDKTESIITYSKTQEFETYCMTKNNSLLSYEYYNTTDNSTPFKKYTFTKTTVHPTSLSWLQKEGSIFTKNPSNYTIKSITPISETTVDIVGELGQIKTTKPFKMPMPIKKILL